MVVPSEHFGWIGLRTVLGDLEGVRVVVGDDGMDEIASLANKCKPDAAFVAADLDGESLQLLVCALRGVSPRSRIIVVGDTLGRDALLALGRLGVSGCLSWDRMTREIVPAVLAATLDAGLQVSNDRIVETFLALPEPGRNAPNDVHLSEHERQVLCDLAAGLTEGEIARKECLSLPTIERVIAELKRKLRARTLYVLGMRVALMSLSSRSERSSPCTSRAAVGAKDDGFPSSF